MDADLAAAEKIAREAHKVYPLCRWAEQRGCCQVECRKFERVVARRECSPRGCEAYEVREPAGG